jgi:hypothetical protein
MAYSKVGSVWYGITIVSLLLFNSGCEVQTAVAPREEVVTTPLRKFPARTRESEVASLRFVNNRIFLWKEDQTPEQMSRTLEIDRWLDDHDLIASKINNEVADLEAKISVVQEQIKNKNLELFKARNWVKKNTDELTKLSKSIIALNQSLKEANSKQPPDEALVKNLEIQLAASSEKQNSLQKENEKLKISIESLNREIAKLSDSPEIKERDQALESKAQDEQEAQDKTLEVSSLVDWFETPPVSVDFTVEKDGKLEVSLDGWVIEKGGEALDFTTAISPESKPTILNAQYLELGGVYLFDVLIYADPAQSQVKESYSFRLARIKYDSADDRVYLGGKFTRTRILANGQTEIRDGMAKLIDKNN